MEIYPKRTLLEILFKNEVVPGFFCFAKMAVGAWDFVCNRHYLDYFFRSR